MFEFRVEAQEPGGAARAGILSTPHGEVATPAFMPVATQAAVKALAPGEVAATGARLVLCNAYHLMLRPGAETVARSGGLHRFMAWPHALLTDSGGFQVFSLAEGRRLDDDGVTFRSHLDGSPQRLTPERAIAVAEALGADVIMPLDECVAADADRPQVERAARRTASWLGRAIAARRRGDQALFGIVQGGMFADSRRRSVEEIAARDLPGYAIGGLSVGEAPERMREVAALTAALLPADRPRYLMGVGSPADLVACIGAGIDLFDCVLPTRNARNGTLFTSAGRVNIRNARCREEAGPLDPACGCPVCRGYSVAYLRHLYAAGEILALSLGTLHNLWFYGSLVRRLAGAIRSGRFAAEAAALLDGFAGGER